jgi:hypothetical protein
MIGAANWIALRDGGHEKEGKPTQHGAQTKMGDPRQEQRGGDNGCDHKAVGRSTCDTILLREVRARHGEQVRVTDRDIG